VKYSVSQDVVNGHVKLAVDALAALVTGEPVIKLGTK